MIEYPRWGAVMAMTAAVLITLSVSAEGQTPPPPPNPAQETTNQGAGANTNNSQTTGGELQQVTVTGYLIPRVGEGPQPVATLNQDFIQKQAYQTVNDVLNNYPGGLSRQNAQTFAGNSNSASTSAFSLKSLPIGSTLVLIDGFRFPTTGISINQGTIPFVDLNSIQGKRLLGEKAIAPAPEGHSWSWRCLLDNTTFTFGIKNLSDAHPPLAFVGNGAYQGYDTYAANPVQRFFYGQIEKKF